MASMRTTENNAKGTSGQSFVKGQFEELGWGAAPNPEHDLGTDLWLMARDARRIDLGALVGAQVKNWDLEFDSPTTHDGAEGWWFTDTKTHFEYWLEHRIPHIVVFYDKQVKVSYWVHITRDATVTTGKQCKIFVPKSQTIAPEHFDALIDVAVSSPPGTTWEGSAWLPGSDIPEQSQLRYALLVPRLIAPHGNSSVEDVSPEQAIALITSVRLWEVRHRYLEKQPLLDRDKSAQSEDLMWRIYGALLTWIEKGDAGLLRSSFTDMPAHVRAAHIAMLAASFYEDGDVRGAITHVESALRDHDDYNPVDHAWLSLHLARNLLQVGRLKEARGLALQVVPIGRIASSDPSARFLTGIASDLVFSLSGWQASDIASNIQARDNAASWWRSQAMTWGLSEHVQKVFKSWANDGSITIGGVDETWTQLRSTMLISGFAADTPNWGHEASLLAQYMLISDGSPNEVASAVSLLRLAGANKELKLAVDRILEYGPIDALQRAVAEVNLEVATRDSLRSDLDLLGLAAPVVPIETADHAAMWMLSELGVADVRAQALGLRFHYAVELVSSLTRLYVVCSENVQSALRRWIVELPVIEDQSLARNIANLIGNVRQQDWEGEQIEALAMRVEGDNFLLTNELEALIASRKPEFRQALEARVEKGDVQALYSWGDVRELSREAAEGMIVATAAAVREKINSAHSGSYPYGGDNTLRRLVLMNVWHPEVADWEPCIEAIADGRSSPNDIIPGIELMTSTVENVPLEVRARFRASLERLSRTAPSKQFVGIFGGEEDPRGAAAELLAALFPDDIAEDNLLQLLSGESGQIVAGIRILASRADVSNLPTFAALANNADIDVRSTVASELAKWVSTGIGCTDAKGLLQRLLDEPGVRLATHVTRAVGWKPRSGGAEVLLGMLEAHPSAVVRLHVKIIREQWADKES
ncbi:MAG: DUF4365 domain-containing protein [Cryobacterium sp.]|nr:DUF4365 domain-containing protein [Cryobacterium sp.]